jgi:hypothetical protein
VVKTVPRASGMHSSDLIPYGIPSTRSYVVKRKIVLGRIALTPHPNQVETAREHAGLKDAQEEARGEKTTIRSDQTLADGD